MSYGAITGAVVFAAVVLGVMGSYQFAKKVPVADATANEVEMTEASDSFEATSSGAALTSMAGSADVQVQDSFEAASLRMA